LASKAGGLQQRQVVLKNIEKLESDIAECVRRCQILDGLIVKLQGATGHAAVVLTRRPHDLSDLLNATGQIQDITAQVEFQKAQLLSIPGFQAGPINGEHVISASQSALLNLDAAVGNVSYNTLVFLIIETFSVLAYCMPSLPWIRKTPGTLSVWPSLLPTLH